MSGGNSEETSVWTLARICGGISAWMTEAITQGFPEEISHEFLREFLENVVKKPLEELI